MADEADYARWTAAIGAEWDIDTGFFWKCRDGLFSAHDFRRTHKILRAISLAEDAVLPLYFVSLLWNIPRFMEWQEGRVGECGGDVVAYRRASDRLANEVERILGSP